MKIEIPIRWSQPITDPDALEKINIKRLISSGDEEEDGKEGMEFVYDMMVMDTEDIASFHRYDEQHTILRTRDIDSYCVKVSYDNFKSIYMDTTGQNIHTLVQSKESKQKRK